MKNIEQLKDQLAEAEAEQTALRVQEELDRMQLVGKCYSTHQLSRYMTNKPSFHFEVIKLKSTKAGGDYAGSPVCFYVADKVRVDKDGDRVFVSIEPNVEVGKHFVNGFHHEITPAQFDHVKTVLSASLQTTVDKIRFDFKADNLISQGDYSDEKGKQAHLEFIDVKFMDLKNHPLILETLRWHHHPYLYNTCLYKLPHWDTIAHTIANRMEHESRIWGGVIYERDMPRVLALRSFLPKQTKNK